MVLKYGASLPGLCIRIIVKLQLFKLLVLIQLLAGLVFTLLVSVFIKVYA